LLLDPEAEQINTCSLAGASGPVIACNLLAIAHELYARSLPSSPSY